MARWRGTFTARLWLPKYVLEVRQTSVNAALARLSVRVRSRSGVLDNATGGSRLHNAPIPFAPFQPIRDLHRRAGRSSGLRPKTNRRSRLIVLDGHFVEIHVHGLQVQRTE